MNLIEINMNENDARPYARVSDVHSEYPTGEALFYVDIRIKINTWMKFSQVEQFLSASFYTHKDVTQCLYYIIKHRLYPVTRVLKRKNHGTVEIYFATCNNILCGRQNAGKKQICDYIETLGNAVLTNYKECIGKADINDTSKAKKITVMGYKLQFIEFHEITPDMIKT